jgi:hypothetical protein
VPFAFYTGQTETDPIRAEWPRCAIVAKPASPLTCPEIFGPSIS